MIHTSGSNQQIQQLTLMNDAYVRQKKTKIVEGSKLIMIPVTGSTKKLHDICHKNSPRPSLIFKLV